MLAAVQSRFEGASRADRSRSPRASRDPGIAGDHRQHLLYAVVVEAECSSGSTCHMARSGRSTNENSAAAANDDHTRLHDYEDDRGLMPRWIAAMPKLRSSHAPPRGAWNPARAIISANVRWSGKRSIDSTRYCDISA